MYINWVTIHVKDLAAAKEFYGGYLGMPLNREFPAGPDTTIAFFDGENGAEIELIHCPSEQHAETKGITIGIRTGKYDELLKIAGEKGIIKKGPVQFGPDCLCFFVEDPDGVEVQVIRY